MGVGGDSGEAEGGVGFVAGADVLADWQVAAPIKAAATVATVTASVRPLLTRQVQHETCRNASDSYFITDQ